MVGISVAPDGTITSDNQVYLVPPPSPTIDTAALQEANPTAVVITPESLPPEVGTPVGQYLGYPNPNQPAPFSGGFMSLGGGQLPNGGGIMPYDRAPALRVKQFSLGAVAPHADVTRFSYTAPTGKLTIIQDIDVHICRVTAPGANGEAACEVYIDSGSELTHHFAVLAFTRNPNPDLTYVFSKATGWIFLAAGDGFHGDTYDSSTGGTVNYNASVLYSEFNV